MKVKKVQDLEQEIEFSATSMNIDKSKPSIKTSVDELNKKEKKVKKRNKIHKFEAFIDIHIDNIENLKIGYKNDQSNEFDADYEEEAEASGCGCCSVCTGLSDCDCGCDDCKCDELEDDSDLSPTEDLMYHIINSIPVTESVFRHGSKKFYSTIKQARKLFERGLIELSKIDEELFETTDMGKFSYFNGELVPLDLPMENIVELNEAEYAGRKVKLNYPMRNSGDGKKYYVYVKDPKSGKVIKINFGDVKGGLTAKVSDPEARKNFASRHKCSTKKDKTKAGYWACRLNKYGHLFGGKTYPGFW
jgi:hypothetical protein